MPAILNQRGNVVVPPQPEPTQQPEPAPVVAAPVGKARVLAQTEPVAPKPPLLEPPVPVLMQHGFTGGIQQFNYRVQKAVDSYQKAYGSMPSPGLLFDVVRSPFDTEQYDHLFKVPLNQASAKAQATVNRLPSTDQLVVRHDGLVEHNNPVRRLLYACPSKTVAKYQQLQKQHPWVAAGMLPLDTGLLGGFWNAVQFAQNHPDASAPLKEGDLTLAQYQQENKIGQSLTASNPLESIGQMAKDQGAAATQTRAEDLALSARYTVARGVSTVKQAQDTLKQIAPDFFTGLPSSGFINQDWQKAIGKYQTSALYFRQQTVQLAKDNHFGDNTGAFIHAWQAKQAAIKKQPFLAQFLSHQPLAFFDYRTHGGAIKNLLSGNTKGWGWANIPTVALGGLVHTAGLALNELSGTVDQAKTDASFVTAYMDAITPKTGVGPGGQTVGLEMTQNQAYARARKVLVEHPTWARVFDPEFDLNNPSNDGMKVLGPVANAAIDLMLGAPRFTGERVAAGDNVASDTSSYFNNKVRLAYNALAQGKLGDAVDTLEGGRGAEALNVKLEDAVKNGNMDFAQYRQHAKDLFDNGNTTIDGAPVNGALLRSLRSKDMVTPKRPAQAVQEIRAKVGALTDQFENSLRSNKQLGATNHAADFIASIRQYTARAAPLDKRYIFDERAPQDVYNWSRVELKDQALSSDLKDEFIRLRANNDVQGIADFNDKLRALYVKAHPDGELARNPLESAGPELESESRAYLFFPHELETTAQKINGKLNALGKAHRQVIVGGSPVPFMPVPYFGGESLAYKHMVADTARRIIGGGGFFGVTGDLKRTQAEVEAALTDNPDMIRMLGVQRSAAKMGEQHWMHGIRPEDPHNFNVGDFADSRPHLDAAGSYLRHNLSSRALKAYQASSPDHLGPLMDLVSGDPEFRSLMFKDAKTFTPSTELQKIPDGLALPTGAEIVEKNNVRYVRWPEGQVPAALRYDGLTTTDAAQALWNRYREIEDAGVKAGVADPLNEALGVLVKNVGPHADHALGDWIKAKAIDMPVRDGLVARSQWDDHMQRWIGTLMTANKWNRATLFDHVFYSTVRDLKAAGWEMGDAVPVAADLAKAQTVYHMLDFANMLQVEQNMRWLSYFATKHRLYWTWIAKQAIHRPGLAAIISDFSDVDVHGKHVGWLDSAGNLNFPLFGKRLYIPATRLFWINAREYPQTSPIVQSLAETGKGLVEGHGAQSLADSFASLTSTSGNVFTRDDQAEALSIKLALVSSGKLPASADMVAQGMTAQQQKQFFEAVNSYSAFYKMQHGDWPTEADAVKHSLVGLAAQSWWNSNLPFPVEWGSPSKASPRVTQLTQQYGKIQDPAKKRAFLDQHPEVALRFGVAQDPAVYLHVNQLWDKFNAAYKQVQAQRAAIYQDILKGGFTPAISTKMSALSASWSATIDQLKIEDASTWAGSPQFPAGKISDGQVVQGGPWSTQLEGDPFASRAFIHQSFDGIGNTELNAHTVGETVVNLQKEAAQLRAAEKTPAKLKQLGYPDEQHVRDRLSQINQTLAPFFAYPKNAPAKLQSAYYSKFVGPYIKERDTRSAALLLAPQDQQDALRSEFRAWKDQHDHPVFLTVGQGGALFAGEGPQFYAKAFAHNQQFAKPSTTGYQTPLSKPDEEKFRAWVSAHKVPFDPNAKTVDYDMRGYWKATGGSAWKPGEHFPDTFKTPYDTTFSAESKYATKDNPFVWSGKDLVDSRTSQVVYSPTGAGGVRIKFPSVVQIGWARLPADQRRLGLAQAVTGDWAHIASYEKTLMGVNTSPAVSQGWSAYADAVRQYSKNPKAPSMVVAQRRGLAREIDKAYPGFYKDWLFAQQPKIERFQATSLYRTMPDQGLFNQVVAGPARAIAKAIRENGHRSYYEKNWRNYVEGQVLPWLDSQPKLKAELTGYGPDFLNTLPG